MDHLGENYCTNLYNHTKVFFILSSPSLWDNWWNATELDFLKGSFSSKHWNAGGKKKKDAEILYVSMWNNGADNSSKYNDENMN